MWKEPRNGERFAAGVGTVEVRNEFEVQNVGYAEGEKRLRSHLDSERSGALRQAKIYDVLTRNGKLSCEVCNADLVAEYGNLGLAGYQVHHRRPISKGKRKTQLQDVAILCANCHGVIHRTNPLSTIKKFALNYSKR
jgi:predicted HNH restriction endonuclease